MLRRTFLRAGSLTSGALLLQSAAPSPACARPRVPLPPVVDPLYGQPIADARAIPRFVNALPRLPRIEVADGDSPSLVLAETTQDVLGGGLGLPTPVWGFEHRIGDGDPVASYPGPTIVARAHRPLRVDWVNALPNQHLLPVDETVHWAFTGHGYTLARHGVPSVVHLHGGHTPSADDGHPDAWYTAKDARGPSYSGTRFTYENTQESATLWYHDHTHGLARLNIYAGLAGFYLLRDDRELELIARGELPGGPYEVELMFQDRTFRPDGRLAYPVHAAHDAGPKSTHRDFYGQVIVVNGKAWPYLDVEPRRYRFRLLNSSNSRFYQLSVNGEWPFPVSLIGSDGGFLERPVTPLRPVLISPGERLDLVADFSEAAGATFDLMNEAPTPFPHGAPVEPPADRVLQIRVGLPFDGAAANAPLPAVLRPEPYTIRSEPARTRQLLLVDRTDGHGRPQPMLGTVEQGVLAWSDPVTETPRLNDTEVWEFYNTTQDAHVVHLHLVQFQVVEEAPFTADQDPETGALSNIQLGEPERVDPAELGPKDTVRVPPGHVTRIRAVFDKKGTYVWHCHMLEHEDHGMMRSFVVG
ncbi:multicopper oxidase family protein [Streptomyces litchfieldiae]|uniref:Multicopper oxidase n=1 Tax=Streptomyces litchfieldiae TaxID=3075543 RepID=A0ABU2MV04_9ACTN|nr:multicopper oxidase [Streptomyces sp. DSM 44938]MDT0344924.1 multicopper oxidase [Streptomyces sp. DSM 44938]